MLILCPSHLSSAGRPGTGRGPQPGCLVTLAASLSLVSLLAIGKLFGVAL